MFLAEPALILGGRRGFWESGQANIYSLQPWRDKTHFYQLTMMDLAELNSTALSMSLPALI